MSLYSRNGLSCPLGIETILNLQVQQLTSPVGMASPARWGLKQQPVVAIREGDVGRNGLSCPLGIENSLAALEAVVSCWRRNGLSCPVGIETHSWQIEWDVKRGSEWPLPPGRG